LVGTPAISLYAARGVGGKSTPTGMSREKGPHRRITATRASGERSISTTALMECVVPMMALATSAGELPGDSADMSAMTWLMPSLGLRVVLDSFHATMPLSGSEDRAGLRMTPSVCVLCFAAVS
jgi:hypothetical protein